MTEVLVVCSGNTCRSPLAAAMLRARLEAEPGMSHVKVSSAGTGATGGAPASEGSYLVALERGLDLSSHRARLLGIDDVTRANLVLTMTDAHRSRVVQLGGGDKVHTIARYAGGGAGVADVADPYGGSVAEYRATASQLAAVLEGVVVHLRHDFPA